MKAHNFPYIALGMGLLLALVVIKGSEPRGDGSTVLPLLTLLVVSEFGFFVTAIGAYLGIRHMRATGFASVYTLITIGCVVLSAGLLLFGIKLWPQ